MIHTIIRSPASQVLTLTPGHTSTLFVALLAGVLAFSYDKWLRRHLGRVTHFFDLLAVLLALVCGVALAATWPGDWARSLFAKIASAWNSGGNVRGDQWATVAAVVLCVIVIAAILTIAKKEHHGQLGAVLATVILLPLVLVATQGRFGSNAMQVLVSISHPALTVLGSW